MYYYCHYYIKLPKAAGTITTIMNPLLTGLDERGDTITSGSVSHTSGLSIESAVKSLIHLCCIYNWLFKMNQCFYDS